MQHNPNPTATAQPPAGIKLEDVLFIIFRHKWKIAIFSCIGFLAAVALYVSKKPVYVSEAKLLLRYVLERKALGPGGADAQVQSPDSRGENIINSELEILDSLDLAVKVAEAVGPDKVLAKSDQGNDRMAAAFLIKNGINAEVIKNSSVIQITLRHPDPAMVQPILQKLIESYLKKHLEVHRGVLADDFLSQQAEQFRFKLTETENKLLSLKTNLGVISVEDLKAFSERRMRILGDLAGVLAEHEQKAAAVRELQKLNPAKTNSVSSEVDVPVDKVQEYKAVMDDYNALNARLTSLLAKHTEESDPVKQVRAALAEAEKRKSTLEEQHPKLLSLNIPTAETGSQLSDLPALIAQAKSLEAKISSYSNQLAQIRSDELAFARAQSQIEQLQRQKEMDEANYKYYSSSWEQAQVEDALGAGKLSNIKMVQEPTPPAKDKSKMFKPVLGTAAGGVILGLALAFLLEFVVDQTLKRPSEIQQKLRWPLFVSIPYKNGTIPGFAESVRNSSAKLLFWRRGRPANQSSDPSAFASPVSPEIAPWETQNKFRSYFEQIRDRLILHFEARAITHKPKIIAVTSCLSGSGVSTIAVGLAASLSQTGDGKVLLVDLNSEKGEAHPFYHGKPGCGLPEVLEADMRDQAKVQQNLYMVKGNGLNGALESYLPKSIADLMPKIKASDYDYIIFDMPPVVRSSVMLRLAGHMDMVLMILEAEKTPRAQAIRAAGLLREANANVVAILNKKQDRIPAWLHTEV